MVLEDFQLFPADKPHFLHRIESLQLKDINSQSIDHPLIYGKKNIKDLGFFVANLSISCIVPNWPANVTLGSF